MKKRDGQERRQREEKARMIDDGRFTRRKAEWDGYYWQAIMGGKMEMPEREWGMGGRKRAREGEKWNLESVE